MQNNFKDAIGFLPAEIVKLLENINCDLQERISEIRLRSGKPIVLIEGNEIHFVNSKGKITDIYSDDLHKISADEISSAFNRLCNFSVYRYSESIARGFVTLSNGHRVGISGTAVLQDGKISSIREINSLNIRIAREYKGCADEILLKVFNNKISDLIIAGPPASGKTTLLRDIARQFSSGRSGKYHKVAIIDERCEIAPVKNGICGFDVGPNTDILSCFPKAEGIMCALRTLSPDLIICDEIGTVEECQAIKSGLNSGVNFILSIHASSVNELRNKPQLESLMKCGFRSNAVLLDNRPCRIKAIYETGEFDDENAGDYFGCNGFYPDRSVFKFKNA